jgi:hypothetical protein
MWMITTDQAVEMYARFCKARYGASAEKIAEERTTELRQSGDREGERVWAKVQRHLQAAN